VIETLRLALVASAVIQQSSEDRVARLHEEIAAICEVNRLYREGGKKKSGAVDLNNGFKD